MTPANASAAVNQSVLTYGNDATDKTSFDEAINQQRDPFLIEKMEQQHKMSMHRKSSASRMSIES